MTVSDSSTDQAVANHAEETSAAPPADAAQPGSVHDDRPAGVAEPIPQWMFYGITLAWVGWLGFLATMLFS